MLRPPFPSSGVPPYAGDLLESGGWLGTGGNESGGVKESCYYVLRMWVDWMSTMVPSSLGRVDSALSWTGEWTDSGGSCGPFSLVRAV